MCSLGREKFSSPKVRQNEPVSLFSESQEAEEDKIDFSKLDLTEAVQHGARERFDQLLEEGLNPASVDRKDISLLHWAALNNRRDIAEVLLDR